MLDRRLEVITNQIKGTMSKKLSREEIERKVNDIIAYALQIDHSELRGDAVLSTDYQADSLDAVDICIQLEQEFDIEIENELFDTAHQMKVSDVYDLVGERL
jgi:acyl carrier protein